MSEILLEEIRFGAYRQEHPGVTSESMIAGRLHMDRRFRSRYEQVCI